MIVHIRRHPRHGSWQIETPEGWGYFAPATRPEDTVRALIFARVKDVTRVVIVPFATEDEE